MARFWKFLLGLDQAGNALLPVSGLIADETNDVTISATVAALALWQGTPEPVRVRALRWQGRIDGFFLWWFGQHCHCADAAFAELSNMRPAVTANISKRLHDYLNAAEFCGLRTKL
jgi:hypothetical protein